METLSVKISQTGSMTEVDGITDQNPPSS